MSISCYFFNLILNILIPTSQNGIENINKEYSLFIRLIYVAYVNNPNQKIKKPIIYRLLNNLIYLVFSISIKIFFNSMAKEHIINGINISLLLGDLIVK